LLKAISAAALAAGVAFPVQPAGIASSDAAARASGNRKPVAVSVGRALFRTEWPAQVLNVYADGMNADVVVGLRVSGEHFHGELTRAQFDAEIAALVERAFAASPAISEVDVWATVPLSVGKGTVVAGDLAAPAWATVFTVSVRRPESRSALLLRLERGENVFQDQDWTRTGLKR
jgi:hypothetical protein